MKLKQTLSCALLLLFLLSACKEKQRVDVIYKKVNSIEDIVEFDTSVVKPYDYTSVVSLSGLAPKEKKQKFIDLILPAVLVAKIHFQDTLDKVNRILEMEPEDRKEEDTVFLDQLMINYKANNIPQLQRKLHTHPNSIILAQAALESGWGTSRFFNEANNIFGVWSFNKKEPRIKSGRSRGEVEIFLRKYKSLSESIEDYFRILARGPYRNFRIRRTETDDPYKLIPLLRNYSENDSIYAARLRQLIRHNELQKYDVYRIDPEYLN